MDAAWRTFDTILTQDKSNTNFLDKYSSESTSKSGDSDVEIVECKSSKPSEDLELFVGKAAPKKKQGYRFADASNICEKEKKKRPLALPNISHIARYTVLEGKYNNLESVIDLKIKAVKSTNRATPPSSLKFKVTKNICKFNKKEYDRCDSNASQEV